jgi:hypothetical protein
MNEVDIHLATKDMLEPFEQIEQSIKNNIMPALEKESFYIDKKIKAKEMLLRVFDLLRSMANAMVNHTAAIIYADF